VTAPISVEEVEHQIAICEALDRDMREYITEIEQDKEVTLVALENTLGTFHVLTMRLEKIGTDSEAINVRLAERLVEPSQ
jgi:recombinational DNA repair protein RecR